MTIAAIVFDFDGVLVESEEASNRLIADALTRTGFPISEADAQARFMGLSGARYASALADFTRGAPLDEFHALHDAAYDAMERDGLAAVAGAVEFVRNLPPTLPRAIASSSSTRWIRAHLAHLGLTSAFGDHLYSGVEHVANGKPAPDLFLHAARKLGVAIGETLVIEDSPVGVTGALASGAQVVGLCAGRHCAAGHHALLRAKGVEWIASSFTEIAERLGFAPAQAASA